MAHPKQPLPPATPEQLVEAREFSSQLHYAFQVRPPIADPSRRRWEVRFKQDLYRLFVLLGSAEFTELPALAIGCVWEHNRRRKPGAPPFDIEAIRIADDTHPAIIPGPGKLKYTVATGEPNGLLPENRLITVWWDEFRTAAVRAVQDVLQGSPSDGQSGKRAERRRIGGHTTPDESSEPDMPVDAPGPATRARLRSRTPGTTRSNAAEGSGTPSTGVAPATRSKKSAGKQRASVPGAARAPAPSQKLSLSEFREEMVPDGPVEHCAPCTNCVARNQPCRVDFLKKPTCQSCSSAKTRCSIAFTYRKDNALASYLGFAYFRMLSQPDIYMAPDFDPDHLPKPLPPRAQFEWFATKFDARKKSKKSSSKALTPAPTAPTPDVPPVPSRRASVGPSEVPVGGAEQGGQEGGVRTYGRTRTRSTSRARSRESSTLRETPLSPAASPLASPSALSSVSLTAPVPPTQKQAGPSSSSSKGKKPKRTQSSKKTRTNTDNRSTDVGSLGLPLAPSDGLASQPVLPADAVTIPPMDSEPEYAQELTDSASAFDASASEFHDTGAESEDEGSRSDWQGAEGGLTTDPDASAPSERDVEDEGTRDHTRSSPAPDVTPPEGELRRSLRTKPGSLARSLGRTIDGTATKTARAAASKVFDGLVPPATFHVRKRLPLSAPIVYGSWRDLPRVGRPRRKGHYPIVQGSPPPPAPRTITESDEKDAAERPETPPFSTFNFSTSVQNVVEMAKERYFAICQMANTLERDSTRLSDKAAGFLERHRKLEAQVRDSAAWTDAMEPLVKQTEALAQDVQDLIGTLANIHSVVSGICDAFRGVPPVPANWIALIEILETHKRMEDLYKLCWCKLGEFQAEVSPLYGQYTSLRGDLDDARHQLGTVLQDAEDQMRPLLQNVSQQLSESLRKLEERVSVLDGGGIAISQPYDAPVPRPASIGDILAVITSLSKRVTALEEHPSTSTAPVVDEHISAYLGRFGLTEDVLRNLSIYAHQHAMQGAGGGSASVGPRITGTFAQTWSAASEVPTMPATTSGRYGGPSTLSALTPLPSAMGGGPSPPSDMQDRGVPGPRGVSTQSGRGDRSQGSSNDKTHR